MSQELIYNCLYAALGLTESILQIWITLTFAVIVSTYVAGQRFERQIFRLLCGLHLLASLVLLTRFLSAASQAFFLKISWSNAASPLGRCRISSPSSLAGGRSY